MPNTRRFVLSFFKKDKYNEAFKEEMLCDELTGEILIRTKDGDIVSYDSLSRYNHHVESFDSLMNAYGVKGSMYKITPGTKILPSAIENTNNMLDEPVYIEGNVNKLVISLDTDTVRTNAALTTDIEPYVSASVGCRVVVGDDETSQTIDMNINISNEEIININNIVGYVNVLGVYIDSINIADIPDDVRVIIHSILLAVARGSGE